MKIKTIQDLAKEGPKKSSSSSRYANTDTFDPKKGKGLQFRINKRNTTGEATGNSVEESPVAEPVLRQNSFFVPNLRFNISTDLLLGFLALVSIVAIKFYGQDIFLGVVTYTDGRVLATAMEVDPDMVASALNEIDVGGE